MNWNRFWKYPVLIGIPTALLYGLSSSWPVLVQERYLAYHLYATATSVAFRRVNLAAAMLVPAVFAIVLLVQLAGHLPRRVRPLARGALALAVMAVFAIIVHLRHLDSWTGSFLQQSANAICEEAGVSSILLGAGGICLLLLMGVYCWTQAQYRPAMRRGSRRLGWLGYRLLVMASCLLVACYLCLDAAMGYYHGHRAVTLAKQPNVILIMVDTLRADHMGCYGYARNTTPHIDAFARESTLYSKAIAQAPWTPWSVFSFMSSRYPDILTPKPGRDMTCRSYAMLSEVMEDRGYATQAIVSNPLLFLLPGYEQGFSVFDTTASQHMELTTSPRVADAAVKRLDTLENNKFFLFLLFTDPHRPYIVHPGFEMDGKPSGMRPARLTHARNATATEPAGFAEARREAAAYDSEIAFTDAHVGRVIDALKQRGLYDGSLIIFLSDHGEELKEHGRLGHQYTLYDEVLNVPLIVKLPGQRQGTVVDGTFPLIDLYPSVLGVLGERVPASMIAGKDMNLRHLQKCRETPIFSATIKGVFSIRDSRYKYILHADRSVQELYDLARDPWEQHDLAAQEPARLARYYRLLQRRPGQLPDIGVLGEPQPVRLPHFTREQADRLRSLGYLQ